ADLAFRWHVRCVVLGMTALSEPTVQSAEEHVLRTFVRHEATTISTSLLFEEADSFARADIARALTQLEREHVLLRYTWDGTDWVTLTLLGIARRGGAAVAPSVRPHIVFEHPHRVRDYRVFVLGIERDGGTWAGWIEFVPV